GPSLLDIRQDRGMIILLSWLDAYDGAEIARWYKMIGGYVDCLNFSDITLQFDNRFNTKKHFGLPAEKTFIQLENEEFVEAPVNYGYIDETYLRELKDASPLFASTKNYNSMPKLRVTNGLTNLFDDVILNCSDDDGNYGTFTPTAPNLRV